MDNTTGENVSLHSHYSDQLFQKKSSAFYVILIVEILMGLVGNALFLISLIKAQGASSNTFILMSSLAMADIVACLTLTTRPLRDLLVTSPNMQQLMCIAGQWIGASCSLCNAVHLFLMASDRFVAISYPHR